MQGASPFAKQRSFLASIQLRVLALFSLALLLRHHACSSPFYASTSASASGHSRQDGFETFETPVETALLVTNKTIIQKASGNPQVDKVVQQKKIVSNERQKDGYVPVLTRKLEKGERQVIMATGLHGGVGNQIYCFLEALTLARRAHLTILSPSAIARTFAPENRSAPAHATPTPFAYLGGEYWDNARISDIVPVVDALPVACKKSLHIYYYTHRSPKEVPMKQGLISTRALMEICFHIGGYNGLESFQQCAARALRKTVFLSRSLPITADVDDSFVAELAALRRDVFPSGVKAPPAGAPVCVFVDGHSYNKRGTQAREYLYSHMHFLHSSKRIRKITDALVKKHNVKYSDMLVMHLRYDEKECFNNRPVDAASKVCIRTGMKPGTKDSVYWAGMEEVVASVAELMHKSKTHAFYLAASPYAPPDVVSKLMEKLQNVKVKVVRSFGDMLPHDDLNFVERQLAVQAKVFIGDYASTWTGTVYYKRRTLGKITLWCAGLRDIETGPYSLKNALKPPSWFEKQLDGRQLAPLSDSIPANIAQPSRV